MSEEIIEKLKICLKDNGNIFAFLKKVSKSETLKDIRTKCNKITENFQFYDGDDALDLESESSLEIGDIVNSEGKVFLKSKEKPKKESLDESEKGIIKSLLDKDLTLDDILYTLRFTKGSNEENLVKKYLDELMGQLKPIPTNLKELFVKLDQAKLPCYQYPSEEIRGKKYYTLLVMGETGSGKTTLLDAFVNYLAGMKYEDKWRYKLVDENHMKDKHTKDSQTTEITSYYVNYERDDGKEINIRIIDTPGLGDTKGVLQDNEIIKKFEALFQEIGELDYILITVKSSTTRFTPSNQYIYDRILEIFGKDAKERFVLMCTFADGGTPSAVSVLKDVIYFNEYFCFNNSGLYIPSDKGNATLKFYWKLAMLSVKLFFDSILAKDLLPLSLTMSKEVMTKRNWLFKSVQSSRERINATFDLLEESNDLLQLIKKNQKLLDENGEFEQYIEKTVYYKKYLSSPTQMCARCGVLCCQYCKWPSGAKYSNCSYFDPSSSHYKGGGCPICPQHCPRESHVKCEYEEIPRKEKVKEVISVKKEAYEKGIKELTYSQFAMKRVISKMSELGTNLLNDMNSIKESLNELEKIALKPRVLTDEQYFIDMIEYEEKERKPGYKERVKGLEIMRDQAKQLNNILKTSDVSALFPTYSETIKELKQKNPKSSFSCILF